MGRSQRSPVELYNTACGTGTPLHSITFHTEFFSPSYLNLSRLPHIKEAARFNVKTLRPTTIQDLPGHKKTSQIFRINA